MPLIYAFKTVYLYLIKGTCSKLVTSIKSASSINIKFLLIYLLVITNAMLITSPLKDFAFDI